MNSARGELQLKGPNTNGSVALARRISNLPSDYVAFLREHDGAEGPVGCDDYLVIWGADEVIKLNETYEVQKYAPGFLIFGSDGGGEAFAFDLQKSPPTVVRLPFVGMDRAFARAMAPTFGEFLRVFART